MTTAYGILELADELAGDYEGEEQSPEAAETWVSFSVAGLGFALPLGHLRGAHRVNRITPVPRSSHGLRGVSNLRGRVRPILDLGVHLGLHPVNITSSSRILEVELEGRLLGLLVDRAEHLEKILPSSVVPLSDDLKDSIRLRANGLVQTRNGGVILLDPDRLLVNNGQPDFPS